MGELGEFDPSYVVMLTKSVVNLSEGSPIVSWHAVPGVKNITVDLLVPGLLRAMEASPTNVSFAVKDDRGFVWVNHQGRELHRPDLSTVLEMEPFKAFFELDPSGEDRKRPVYTLRRSSALTDCVYTAWVLWHTSTSAPPTSFSFHAAERSGLAYLLAALSTPAAEREETALMQARSAGGLVQWQREMEAQARQEVEGKMQGITDRAESFRREVDEQRGEGMRAPLFLPESVRGEWDEGRMQDVTDYLTGHAARLELADGEPDPQEMEVDQDPFEFKACWLLGDADTFVLADCMLFNRTPMEGEIANARLVISGSSKMRSQDALFLTGVAETLLLNNIPILRSFGCIQRAERWELYFALCTRQVEEDECYVLGEGEDINRPLSWIQGFADKFRERTGLCLFHEGLFSESTSLVRQSQEKASQRLPLARPLGVLDVRRVRVLYLLEQRLRNTAEEPMGKEDAREAIHDALREEREGFGNFMRDLLQWQAGVWTGRGNRWGAREKAQEFIENIKGITKAIEASAGGQAELFCNLGGQQQGPRVEEPDSGGEESDQSDDTGSDWAEGLRSRVGAQLRGERPIRDETDSSFSEESSTSEGEIDLTW